MHTQVTAKELAFACRLRGVSPVELPVLHPAPRSSINQLAAAFIEGLQVGLGAAGAGRAAGRAGCAQSPLRLFRVLQADTHTSLQ